MGRVGTIRVFGAPTFFKLLKWALWMIGNLKKKNSRQIACPIKNSLKAVPWPRAKNCAGWKEATKYNLCVPGMGLARARNVCWMAALWKNAKHTKWNSCQRLWGQDPRPQWVLVFSPVFRAFHIQSKTVWKAQGFDLEEVKMAELMMVNQVSNCRKYHGWEARHIRSDFPNQHLFSVLLSSILFSLHTVTLTFNHSFLWCIMRSWRTLKSMS